MHFSSDVDHSMGRVVFSIILLFFAFRVVLSLALGLGVDESYDISVAHDLKLSYYDHPPLHYWITHFFMPLLGDGRAVRLPFNVLFIGTTWTLYLLTRQLFGAVAGFWAVLALNLSAFFTLAGGWVLPDGPLMFCLLAAAYMIARALFPDARAAIALENLDHRRNFDRACRAFKISRGFVRCWITHFHCEYAKVAQLIASPGSLAWCSDCIDYHITGDHLE